MPTLAELGNEWGDESEIVRSPDVDNPPATCAPYAAALTAPHHVLVHQYSFLPTASGFESGSASFSVAAVASPLVSTSVLRATASDSYRTCALDTATRWLSEQPGYESMSAQRVPLPADLPGVMWRIRAVYNANDTYFLDIAYLANDSILAKARIGVCSCAQQTVGVTIVDGEYSALEHIAHALSLSP
jgi:hypothetical protein